MKYQRQTDGGNEEDDRDAEQFEQKTGANHIEHFHTAVVHDHRVWRRR